MAAIALPDKGNIRLLFGRRVHLLCNQRQRICMSENSQTFTGARANTIFELARALVQKDVDFNFCARPETEVKKLMTIPGIGTWTAQYIAMRAMGWPDAFLPTDYGVKKALEPRTRKEILDLAEAWRPWRSYATINLWNCLYSIKT